MIMQREDGIICFTGKRQSGKTTALIMEASKNNGTIVTYNERSKKNIKEQSKMLNINIKDPITYDEFFKIEKVSSCFVEDRYYIDDADVFLKEINHNIEGITLTNRYEI